MDFLLWTRKPGEDWKKEVEDKSKDLCLHVISMKMTYIFCSDIFVVCICIYWIFGSDMLITRIIFELNLYFHRKVPPHSLSNVNEIIPTPNLIQVRAEYRESVFLCEKREREVLRIAGWDFHSGGAESNVPGEVRRTHKLF